MMMKWEHGCFSLWQGRQRSPWMDSLNYKVNFVCSPHTTCPTMSDTDSPPLPPTLTPQVATVLGNFASKDSDPPRLFLEPILGLFLPLSFLVRLWQAVDKLSYISAASTGLTSLRMSVTISSGRIFDWLWRTQRGLREWTRRKRLS